jgi:hypothetical protein
MKPHKVAKSSLATLGDVKQVGLVLIECRVYYQHCYYATVSTEKNVNVNEACQFTFH